MTLLADLGGALEGWRDILAGRPTAAARFRTDPAGIAMAVATLLVAALLSVAVQSAAAGPPGPLQLLLGLVALGLTIAALAAVMQRARRLFGVAAPLPVLLVPLLYALASAFLVAIPLLLVGPDAGLLVIAGLALAIWRLAAIIGALRAPHSIMFSALCVMVLVVVPYALYMLLLLFPPA